MIQNQETYYKRMTAALGDKEKLLGFVKGSRVLDVGTGSGDLLHALLEAGYDAWGVDPSLESLDRVVDPERVKEGYADELVELFGEGTFDTVICSSVLHEVFSYGNRDGAVGQLKSVDRVIEAVRRVLIPEGRLIIRDGVSPNFYYPNIDKEEKYEIWVDNPAAVEIFLTTSPFTRPGLDRKIELERVSEHRFRGTRSSLMEFAFTYTWGDESFAREVQEYYGLWNLIQYKAYVSWVGGFEPVSAFSYVQPGYEQHLRNKVIFYTPSFPATNAVWVFDVENDDD